MEILPDMFLRMANGLTSKGYLQEIGMDCAEHQNSVHINAAMTGIHGAAIDISISVESCLE